MKENDLSSLLRQTNYIHPIIVHSIEMNKKTSYQAINCKLYDQLLLWSTRKTICHVTLKSSENEDLQGIITDVFTKDKVEYMCLDQKEVIRLDHIMKINNMLFAGNCTL